MTTNYTSLKVIRLPSLEEHTIEVGKTMAKIILLASYLDSIRRLFAGTSTVQYSTVGCWGNCNFP